MDDEERLLISRCRAGDRAAFEAVVRRSARWLYARIYLEVGDRHRAEDLVQETYLVAWRAIHELAEPSAFYGWLGTIAHRVMLDTARHETRNKRLGGRVAAADVFRMFGERAGETLTEAEDAEERERALVALRELPPAYREPLVMRYLGGADYQAITKQLSLTNGSLRGLLKRGMDLLRERLNVEPRRPEPGRAEQIVKRSGVE